MSAFFYCDTLIALSIILILAKRLTNSPEYMSADDGIRREIVRQGARRASLLAVAVALALLFIELVI